MKKTLFTGSCVAIVTPMNEHGVDFESFGKLLEFHMEHHTDAVVVCGTTGESSTMPDAEHLSCIEFAVKKINHRIPVIAGTGSNDTPHAIYLSQSAEKLGADGLLLVTPYYNKTTQKGLVKHFNAIADSVSIPCILYNVPSRTGVNIAPETVLELSKHPNIVGIKEASGNISFTAKIAATCPDDFAIYSGNDDMIVPILSLGGKGVISVLANVLPQETHDMVDFYLKGEVAKSTALQLKYLDLINSLFIEVNPIPVKTALNLLGMNAGVLRMPLCEMEDKNLAVLKRSLENAGLLSNQ